jgi:spore coat polysaccharide biosynthesis predicted glycosyltransferase SpsG
MRLLLRCDGGPGIGVGHVVRSLAIAQEATARGHEVGLLGRIEGDFLTQLADEVGPGLTLLGPSRSDQPAELAAAAQGFDVLHVDHYEVPDGLAKALSGYQSEPVGAPGPARPLLSVMADGVHGAQPADLLTDPTVESELSPAPARATWHLRGARYVALRRSVTELRPAPGADESHTVDSAPDERPTRVLVVMGGTDAAQCAPLVVDALAATGARLDVTVVSSPSTAAALAHRADSWNGSLRVTPPVPDLPSAMAEADLVVSAAGTSVWELCAMARPMAVVAVVENQGPGYAAVVRAGAAVGLGGPDELADTAATAGLLGPVLAQPGLRSGLAARASELVDGQGAWRLVSSFEAVLAGATPTRGPGPVTMRPATEADAEELWRWRNDPDTRANSRSHEPVPLPDHLRWLRASLARGDRQLLVGEVDEVPVGTVRWDLERPGEWEVSITVAPESRGQRLGAPLLAAAEAWLAGALSSATGGAAPGGDPAAVGGLTAYLAAVHTGNAASPRLFLGAGYLPDLPADGDGFERFVKVATPGPR